MYFGARFDFEVPRAGIRTVSIAVVVACELCVGEDTSFAAGSALCAAPPPQPAAIATAPSGRRRIAASVFELVRFMMFVDS